MGGTIEGVTYTRGAGVRSYTSHGRTRAAALPVPPPAADVAPAALVMTPEQAQKAWGMLGRRATPEMQALMADVARACVGAPPAA